jgi:hypothetical protein
MEFILGNFDRILANGQQIIAATVIVGIAFYIWDFFTK